jgi:hypothetical protein
MNCLEIWHKKGKCVLNAKKNTKAKALENKVYCVPITHKVWKKTGENTYIETSIIVGCKAVLHQ